MRPAEAVAYGSSFVVGEHSFLLHPLLDLKRRMELEEESGRRAK